MAAASASPWLDAARFPGRAFLASVWRQHQPLGRPARGAGEADLEHAVRRRWAAHLGVALPDLLFTVGACDAFRLVLQGLLAPGDVALVAEPAPMVWLGAVLAAGAGYVDVGRRSDGSLDPAALALAVAAHPGAVAAVESPSLFATDDREILREHGSVLRAVVVDARHDARWGGPRLTGADRPLATIAALRDPDQPTEPLLHAIACAPGTGPDLALVQGEIVWPRAVLRQALAVLEGLEVAPQRCTAADTRLERRHARFVEALGDRPGVRLLPRAGTRVAAECMAGDAAEVAAHLESQGIAPVAGHGAWPMRNLVVKDLCAR